MCKCTTFFLIFSIFRSTHWDNLASLEFSLGTEINDHYSKMTVSQVNFTSEPVIFEELSPFSITSGNSNELKSTKFMGKKIKKIKKNVDDLDIEVTGSRRKIHAVAPLLQCPSHRHFF